MDLFIDLGQAFGPGIPGEIEPPCLKEVQGLLEERVLHLSDPHLRDSIDTVRYHFHKGRIAVGRIHLNNPRIATITINSMRVFKNSR